MRDKGECVRSRRGVAGAPLRWPMMMRESPTLAMYIMSSSIITTTAVVPLISSLISRFRSVSLSVRRNASRYARPTSPSHSRSAFSSWPGSVSRTNRETWSPHAPWPSKTPKKLRFSSGSPPPPLAPTFVAALKSAMQTCESWFAFSGSSG